MSLLIEGTGRLMWLECNKPEGKGGLRGSEGLRHVGYYKPEQSTLDFILGLMECY